MSDQVERFSHGPDGFWQDPDGLYVERSDYEKLGAVERDIRVRAEDRLERLEEAEKKLTDARKQRDEELREHLLSASSLRALAKHQHDAEHTDGFDDCAWDNLPVDRQLRTMGEAKAALEVVLATFEEGDGE
jgi:hypothetical protein